MTTNMRQSIGIFLCVVIAMILAGCAESNRPGPTGKARVRGIAAIVDSTDVSFRIEERGLGTLRYKNASEFTSWDDLSYNFNFDTFLPTDDDLVRIATQFIDLTANNDYTLILTGTVADPVIVTWEDETRDWVDTETVFQPTFAHLSPTLGTVDVYFAASGTVPQPGNAVATLANGERLLAGDFETDAYELILTAPGDPASIVYSSVEITGNAQTRPVFAIFDADPSITGPVAVNLIGEAGASLPVPDPAFPSQLRIYHAAFGTENIDVYIDDDFGNRIFADVGFKELTPYAELDLLDTTLTFTAVDNTGAILIENEIAVPPGVKRTIALAGEPATLVMNLKIDQPRPLAAGAVLRVSNFAINEDFVKAYLLEPGTEITASTSALFAGLGTQLDTGYFDFRDGSFEMTLTDVLDIVPIAPSILIDLAPADVVEIAILDTADPEVFDVEVIDRQ